jgi:hypothetical protein
VQRYSDLEKTTETSNQSFLLFNPYTLQLSGLSNDDLPYTARHPDETATLIARDEETQMELYQIAKVVSPRDQGTVLVFIEEDFEDANSELEFNQSNYIERTGRSAYTLGEYSGTFRMPYDSISVFAEKHAFVLFDVDVYAEERVTPRIAIVIEKDGEVFFRDDKYLVRKGMIFGAWNTVKTEVRLPKFKEKGSQLLIYIWNPKNEEMCIDSLRMTIKVL